MTIQAKISFKEYLSLMYKLTYRKLPTILLTVLGGFFLLLVMVYVVFFIFSEHRDFSRDILSIAFIGLIFLLLTPWSVYRQSKKGYDSNAGIKELLTYDIEVEVIHISGESFKSEMNWDKIWKIKELRDWILIYHSSQTFNPIPKRTLTDEQLANFWQIVDAHPTMKK